MAPLNLYDVTVPPLIHSLTSLSSFLQKGTTALDAQTLPSTRLHADMLPMTFQVQSACNTAKFIPVRVASVPNVAVEDNETTMEQLQDRISSTIDFLKTKVTREDFEGKEEAVVEFRGLKFDAVSYVTLFALPNFYFHVAAAYAILRKEGVEVGKMDYLGPIKDMFKGE